MDEYKAERRNNHREIGLLAISDSFFNDFLEEIESCEDFFRLLPLLKEYTQNISITISSMDKLTRIIDEILIIRLERNQCVEFLQFLEFLFEKGIDFPPLEGILSMQLILWIQNLFFSFDDPEIIVSSMNCSFQMIMLANHQSNIFLNEGFLESMLSVYDFFSSDQVDLIIAQYTLPSVLGSLAVFVDKHIKNIDSIILTKVIDIFVSSVFREPDPFLSNALWGLSKISQNNLEILIENMPNNLILRLIDILRFHNKAIITYTLSILNDIVIYDFKSVDFGVLQKGIQPHLLRRSYQDCSEILILSCRILSIFLNDPKNHEIAYISGVISMVCSLLNDQQFEVKTESTMVLCNLIQNASDSLLQEILINYDIISPIMLILDSDSIETVVGVLYAVKSIIDRHINTSLYRIHINNIKKGFSKVYLDSLKSSSFEIIKDLTCIISNFLETYIYT